MMKFLLGLTVGVLIGAFAGIVFIKATKNPDSIISFEAKLGQEKIDFKTYNQNGPVAEFSFDMTAENYGVTPAYEFQERKFKLQKGDRGPQGSIPYEDTTIFIKDGFPIIREK